MVKKECQVVWTKRSLQQLKAAYKYIYLDSPLNALKAIEDIATSQNKAIYNKTLNFFKTFPPRE